MCDVHIVMSYPGHGVTRAESLSAANGHRSDCGACPHIVSSDFANAKLLSIIPLLHTGSGGPRPCGI